MNKNIDIKVVRNFLEQEICPTDLAKLLDEFLFDYTDKLVRLQQLDEETSLHIDTAKFIYFLRRLRDVLVDY